MQNYMLDRSSVVISADRTHTGPAMSWKNTLVRALQLLGKGEVSERACGWYQFTQQFHFWLKQQSLSPESRCKVHSNGCVGRKMVYRHLQKLLRCLQR